MAKRSMISQLASVSEGAIGKTFQAGMQVKDRVERMVHAITELDDRVAALEQRVDALEKPKRPSARKSPAGETDTKPRASASKTGASAGKGSSRAALAPAEPSERQ